MIQSTILKYVLGGLLIIFLASGYTAYVYHKGVLAQQQKSTNLVVKEKEALQTKYNKVSKDYTDLEQKRKAVAQRTIQKQERLIDENKDYYSVDVLDATSLQYIQSVQQGRDTP